VCWFEDRVCARVVADGVKVKFAPQTVSRCLAVCLVALLSAMLAEGQAAQLDRWPISAQQVDRAIEAMQAYLIGQQNRTTGRWPGRYDEGSYEGGRTTLATLALVESGISIQEAAVARGVQACSRIPMDKTYTRSLRAQLMAKLPKPYAAVLRRDVQWLGVQQDGGGFSYGENNRGSGQKDQSNTHFGVLGFAAYEQQGGRVSRRAWGLLSEHLLDTQNEDGGWGYRANGGSSAAMSAAGLTGLLSARWSLERTRNQSDPRVVAAVDAGFEYLGQHLKRFSPGGGGSHGLYGLLAIERCLLWDGRSQIAGEDWFKRYAYELLKSLRDDGSVGDGVIDTSFALIFLSRGRVPVWASKLALQRQAWNNRPNDLNRFTRRLSDWREVDLGWQVVAITGNSLKWLNAPILYLSIDEPLTLVDAELAAIKQYIDLGGLLVINPEPGPGATDKVQSKLEEIIESVQETLARVYPTSLWGAVDAGHPLMDLVLAPVNETKAPMTLNNGARDLVVMLPSDYGKLLQSDHESVEAEAVRSIMTNLYAWVTNRGRDRPRLATPLVEPMNPMPARSIRVVRAVPAGYESTEWYAWTPFAARFQWVTDRTLLFSSLTLDKIASVQAPIVHLPGTSAIELSDAELDAVVAYTQRGGLLLVETVGGRGDFARSVSKQLDDRLGRGKRMGGADPIITGRVRGAMDRSVVGFQHFTQLNFPFKDVPRLLMHEVDGRPAVLISELDLSLAAMDLNRYGIHGYSIDSARGLLVNILLYAEQAAESFASQQSAEAVGAAR